MAQKVHTNEYSLVCTHLCLYSLYLQYHFLASTKLKNKKKFRKIPCLFISSFVCHILRVAHLLLSLLSRSPVFPACGTRSPVQGINRIEWQTWAKEPLSKLYIRRRFARHLQQSRSL